MKRAFALLVVIGACSVATNVSPPVSRSSLAQQAVFYAASQVAAPGEAGLLVKDSTLRFSPRVHGAGSDIDSAAGDLLPALVRANSISQPVSRLGHGERFRVAGTDGLRAIFRGGGDAWAKFFAAFPLDRGYYAVTSPVFSPDSSTALVYVEYHCGSLCGQGELYLVRRDGQRWKTVRRVRYWIS
jgi:hypothetical protein